MEKKESIFSFFFRPEDDHTADYDNLPEFFQKLVDEMDVNDDGKVSREEIKLALKQEPIARRLSRLICVHPSEWWAGDDKSFWKPQIRFLEQLISVEPGQTEAYLHLGDSYWTLGRHGRAKNAYRKYLIQIKARPGHGKAPARVAKRVGQLEPGPDNP